MSLPVYCVRINMAESKLLGPSICVVGGGISGISSAFQIINKYPECQVTIIADVYTPNTTSDGAAGLWEPYVLADPRKDLIRYWSKATYDWLKVLSRLEEAPDLGIFMLPVYQVYDYVLEELPDWTGIALGFRILSQEEVTTIHPNAKYGFTFTTFIVQGACYLPWLLKCCKQRGCKVIQRKLNSLAELSDEYDVVVNCSGFGARELIGDMTVTPIRGQVLRVEAPWIKHAVFYDTKEMSKQHRSCYIIPQINSVVIGGTKQKDFNTEVSDEDTEYIFKYCSGVFPSLKNAKIKQVWAGLRPTRPYVRIEKEIMIVTDKNGIKRPLKVVHNYGHGGSGLSLHHGCALDTCQMVMEILNEPIPHQPKL